MKAQLSKDAVLADVGTLVQKGDITLNDLQRIYTLNAPADAPQVSRPLAASRPGLKIGNALYIVGTLIVCLGICLLIGGNWNQMNTGSRIISTMGLGLLVFAWALYRGRKQAVDVNHDLLTASLFTIASVAMAVGVGVIVHELNGDLSDPDTLAGTAAATSGAFALLYLLVVRSAPLLTLAIAAAVAAYFGAVEWLIPSDNYGHSELFYAVETFIAGAAVLTGGLLFRRRVVASLLCDVMYIAGTLMTLGAFFWLTLSSGFSSDETVRAITYDMLYPVFLGFAVWLSVYAQSRSILILTALFLTGYIFEISFEYFSDYLGGALALCLAGVLVLVLAYVTTRFAKRYIPAPARN